MKKSILFIIIVSMVLINQKKLLAQTDSIKGLDIGSERFNNERIEDLIIKNILLKLAYDKLSNKVEYGYFKESKYDKFNIVSDFTDCPVIYDIDFKRIDNPILSNIELYSFNGFGQTFFTDDPNLIGPDRIKKSLPRKGIIGIDRVSGEIIFVSGYFFLDDIKAYLIDNYDLTDYIKLRYFNYNPENIEILSKNPLSSVVSFYSKLESKAFIVELSKKDQDFIYDRKFYEKE